MTSFFSIGAPIIFIPASVGAGAFVITSSNGFSLSFASLALDGFTRRSILANFANAASTSDPRPVGSVFIIKEGAGSGGVGAVSSVGVGAAGIESFIVGAGAALDEALSGAELNEALVGGAVNEAFAGAAVNGAGAGAPENGLGAEVNGLGAGAPPY